MEHLKQLLKTDGQNAQEFLTDSLARAFVDISDGSIENEYHREFEQIEVYMIIKKRGK